MKDSYNVVIVDDEKPQQEITINMLTEHFPHYTIQRVCSSVAEGLECLQVIQPDLIFLDVVMPPSNGFELLKQLGKFRFEVIFTTSFEEFALRAFKVAAVDYLLKPFGIEDLRNAITKFEEKVNAKNSLEHIETLLKNISGPTGADTKIALPVMNGFTFAKTKDIVRCQSDNTYTTFYFLEGKPLMVSRTLKECEELLEEFGFFRVHNSHLINMSHIKEYIRGEGGQVKMQDGSVIDVSRRRKEEFLEVLNKL